MWYGNRILQDYNGKHVFTTVYEEDSFVPLARLVWKDEPNQDLSNTDEIPQSSATKLAELKASMLKHIEEDEESEGLDGLEGLKELESINEQDQEKLIAFPKPNKPTKQHSTHEIYWYQNDHLGTPRELTQHNGDIAWEAVYQAWGNTVTVEWQEVAHTQELNSVQLNGAENAFLLQPHRFQGQIYDNETGLHYNRFRYYDPDAGRFISHDPIGLLGGDNNFKYAPNPVEWVDPFGLESEAITLFKLALSKQPINDDFPAKQYKIKFSENGYDYEIRAHGPDPTAPDGSNSKKGSTIRVSRRKQLSAECLENNPKAQGNGWEEADDANNWYSRAFLKTAKNGDAAANQAANTVHIPLPSGLV